MLQALGEASNLIGESCLIAVVRMENSIKIQIGLRRVVTNLGGPKFSLPRSTRPEGAVAGILSDCLGPFRSEQRLETYRAGSHSCGGDSSHLTEKLAPASGEREIEKRLFRI